MARNIYLIFRQAIAISIVYLLQLFINPVSTLTSVISQLYLRFSHFEFTYSRKKAPQTPLQALKHLIINPDNSLTRAAVNNETAFLGVFSLSGACPEASKGRWNGESVLDNVAGSHL